MLLIKNAHIKTMAGTELENGCILVGDNGKIAQIAGITVPENTKILIGEVESVELSEPFAHEKLSPVLAMYRTATFEEAIDKAQRLLEDGGYGHTAAVYLSTRTATEKLDAFSKRMKACRIVVNTPERFAPHIISITMPGVLASHAVNALSEKEICVSVGSACSSNGGHQSTALENFGLDKTAAGSTVRVSIGIQNTEDEMKQAAQAVNAVYSDLLSVFA